MHTGDKVIEGIKKAWASRVRIPWACLSLKPEGVDRYASRWDATGHRLELKPASSVVPRSCWIRHVVAQVPPNLGSVPRRVKMRGGRMDSPGVRFRF